MKTLILVSLIRQEYLNHCSSTQYHELITDDLQDIECDDYGFFIEDDIDNNIVSEWEESIDEEELGNITNKYLQTKVLYRIDENEQFFINLIGSAFKSGYRKALEQL